MTCMGTYIYRRLIGLPMSNPGIQPLLLNLQTKLETVCYRNLVIMSTKEVQIYRPLHTFSYKYFVNDEIN